MAYYAPPLPTGSVLDYAGSSAPAGFLMCDGSAVSRTTYAALFTICGTTFGAGDGSTTFNVPDCRGRCSIGAGTGSGLSARTLGGTVGTETHQLTTAEMPAHTHTIAGYANASVPVGGSTVPGTGGPATQTTNSTGGGGSHNNMQPSLVFNKIIAI